MDEDTLNTIECMDKQEMKDIIVDHELDCRGTDEDEVRAEFVKYVKEGEIDPSSFID